MKERQVGRIAWNIIIYLTVKCNILYSDFAKCFHFPGYYTEPKTKESI